MVRDNTPTIQGSKKESRHSDTIDLEMIAYIHAKSVSGNSSCNFHYSPCQSTGYLLVLSTKYARLVMLMMLIIIINVATHASGETHMDCVQTPSYGRDSSFASSLIFCVRF